MASPKRWLVLSNTMATSGRWNFILLERELLDPLPQLDLRNSTTSSRGSPKLTETISWTSLRSTLWVQLCLTKDVH